MRTGVCSTCGAAMEYLAGWRHKSGGIEHAGVPLKVHVAGLVHGVNDKGKTWCGLNLAGSTPAYSDITCKRCVK